MITLQERVHSVPPPSDWTLSKLHRVFRVRRGHKNTGMKEDNLLSLSYGRIIQKSIDTAEGLLPESFETYQIVEPGNIVMRLTDLQNDKRSLRQGLVKERGIITSAYDALELETGHDPRFWAYVLLALDLAKYYYSLGGGVRQSIKFLDFPNDWIAVPNTEIQRDIANFLDRRSARIDQLIEKKQRLIEVLFEERDARISKAITKGFYGSAHLVETDSKYLPLIPQNWKIWRLKQLARVRGGLTLGRTVPDTAKVRRVPYLRVANVQAGWLDLSDVAEISATESEIHRFCLEDGDVLMNEGGDNDKLGRGAVWRSPFYPCLNQNHVFCVRTHDMECAEWVSMATNARYARDFFYLHSKQSTNLASISKANLGRFPIPLPPRDERRAILQDLKQDLAGIQDLVDKTNQSIERLNEYRSALITAAVTGQIDVATWGKRGETDRRLDEIAEEMAADAAEGEPVEARP